MTLAMFDSVNLDQIPPEAVAVAGYTSGWWPTYASLAGRWPNAQRLSIAVNAAHDADMLDVEYGDARPEDAPPWVRREHARGLARPGVYTSVSVAQALLDRLAAAGIPRLSIRLWTAHYSYVEHLCGPQCRDGNGRLFGLREPADATQWTNRARGKNLDQSLVADGFFAPPAPPPPSPVTITRGTLGGKLVADQIVLIPTDADGDGSVPAPPGFLLAASAGSHDKYDPNTGDTNSIVVPIGQRRSGDGWRLVVAGGPRSTTVGAPVLVSDG